METGLTPWASLRRLKVTQRAMERVMLGVSLRDRMKRSANKPSSPMLPEKLLNIKGILLAETMVDGATKFLNGGREPEGTALVGSIPIRWSDDMVKVTGSRWIWQQRTGSEKFGGGLYPEVDPFLAEMIIMTNTQRNVI